ncbi:hypothetical protein HDU67_005836 [Dinochytrium kinnereticum]|nr:hypothetical protein HDU67_005836 [Dinochytrium kinnereticum]
MSETRSTSPLFYVAAFVVMMSSLAVCTWLRSYRPDRTNIDSVSTAPNQTRRIQNPARRPSRRPPHQQTLNVVVDLPRYEEMPPKYEVATSPGGGDDGEGIALRHLMSRIGDGADLRAGEIHDLPSDVVVVVDEAPDSDIRHSPAASEEALRTDRSDVTLFQDEQDVVGVMGRRDAGSDEADSPPGLNAERTR